MIDRYRHLIFLAVAALPALFAGTCSSTQQSSVELPVDGSFAYVEDVDGEDGLRAGQFGEIIVLDASVGSRRQLTADAYYDASPSWSPTCFRLMFESKRDAHISRLAGLTEPSKLYLMDVASNDIAEFNVNALAAAHGDGGKNARKPAWATSGDRVVFLMDQGSESVLADVDLRDSVLIIININLSALNNFHWAPTDSILAFDYGSPQAAVRAVGIYDFSNRNTRIITRNIAEGPRYGEKAVTCSAGDWLPSSEGFFYSCRSLGGSVTSIYQYSVHDSSRTFVAELEGVRASSPLYLDQKLLFIARTIPSGGSDIWMYDLKSDELNRITSDGRDKAGLSVCRSD